MAFSAPEVSVRIKTESGPIPIDEFSYFLYLFRATYAASLKSAQQMSFAYAGMESNLGASEIDLMADRLRAGLEAENTHDLANASLSQDEELVLVDIRRENPLELIIGAVTVPLAAAVVVSGGKFELGPLKVELPPLGKGIAELRKAWKIENSARSGVQIGPNKSRRRNRP